MWLPDVDSSCGKIQLFSVLPKLDGDIIILGMKIENNIETESL